MKDRRNLIFWMGGIVSQSLLELVTSVLEKTEAQEVNLLARPHIQEIIESLSLGKIGDAQLIEEINTTGLSQPKLDQILMEIKDGLYPQFSTLDVIKLLPPKYQRWLICEFPAEWFWHFYERYEVKDYFQKDHVIFLSELGLSRIEPDLFELLPHYLNDNKENCLYFDKDSKRIISAINSLFPAAIYVDATRLEREFIMRNFIVRQQPLHIPNVAL